MFKSGYGCQTALWTKHFQALGHEVTISNVLPVLPTFTDMNGIRNLSSGPRSNFQNYGNDLIQAHVRHERPDVVLSCCDTFSFDPQKFKRIPWVAWHFIDCEPLMPQMVPAVEACGLPLGPTRWGRNVMREHGVKAEYCPLAYDPMEYYPEPREHARQFVGKVFGIELGDKPLVMVNSANHNAPSRKGFGATFMAFSRLLDMLGGRESAWMLMHTEMSGLTGENLKQMAELYGVASRCLCTPQYDYNQGNVGSDYLRACYNAADVYLLTSVSEGFGLPIIEAQACGCPVVVPDFGGNKELVRAGVAVKRGARYAAGAYTTRFAVCPDDTALLLQGVLADDRPDAAKLSNEIEREFAVANVCDQRLMPLIERALPGLNRDPKLYTGAIPGTMEETP